MCVVSLPSLALQQFSSPYQTEWFSHGSRMFWQYQVIIIVCPSIQICVLLESKTSISQSPSSNTFSRFSDMDPIREPELWWSEGYSLLHNRSMVIQVHINWEICKYDRFNSRHFYTTTISRADGERAWVLNGIPCTKWCCNPNSYPQQYYPALCFGCSWYMNVSRCCLRFNISNDVRNLWISWSEGKICHQPC